jgi:hypothetical protein
LDFIDIVALFADGQLDGVLGLPPTGTLGKDMCVWSVQSLPPPPGEDGKYHFPYEDAQKLWDLCRLANSRFQAEIGQGKHDGAVVFGGCTVGSRGAKEICDLHLNADSNSTYCDHQQTQNSSVTWPQAVTMFRVRPFSVSDNAALKSFMFKWSSEDRFHATHIRWVREGGTGSPNGSVFGGWGGGGKGLTRKIVPCDAIDPK